MDATTSRVKNMRCHDVHRELSVYLDGRSSAAIGRSIKAHLDACEDCSSRLDQLSSARAAVAGMARMPVPAGLQAALQLLAYREASRRARRQSWRAALANWADTLRIRLDNVMRPLAIPAAGGVLSAVLLFGSLVPAFTRTRVFHDVPTAFYTPVAIDDSYPMVFHDTDIIVDLTIDQEGRMIDYALPYQPALAREPEIRNAIASRLLFARFTPATLFFQPISGKIRITLLNVRG